MSEEKELLKRAFESTPKPIKLYFDYKSPFAYLAKDEAYRLEEDCRLSDLQKHRHGEKRTVRLSQKG